MMLMGQITSLFVYKVVAQAAAGVETSDLVNAMGLDPEGPVDAGRMVSSADYYAFFAALEARDPTGVGLPLRIGSAMQCDEFGAFGLAWKSAPDLRGSYLRSERYGRVLGNAETYFLEPHDDGVYYTLEKSGDDSRGMILSNEASLAAVAAISAEVSTATFSPKAVYFKHQPRGDVSIHAAHFGCPVHFGSERDALLISEETLAAPNKLGDETIADFFDRYLEKELADLNDRTGLEQQVRMVVADRLSEGVPSISDVATRLGMSARTLQRRLSVQGQSFQSLVDLARQELAKQLLRDTNYSLAEVAFLTGYSEQSAFTRAFKRWAGKTPRSYRLG